LLNQKEVLDALAKHKYKSRFVPPEVDRGEEEAIKSLADSMKAWLKKRAVEEVDVLNKLKTGDISAVKRLKENITIEDKFQSDNFDLIVWFLVSRYYNETQTTL